MPPVSLPLRAYRGLRSPPPLGRMGSLGPDRRPAIFWTCLHLCASPIGMGGRSRSSDMVTWSNRGPSPRARRRLRTQSLWTRTGSRSATSSVSAHRPSSTPGRPFGGVRTAHMRRVRSSGKPKATINRQPRSNRQETELACAVQKLRRADPRS